MKPVAKFLTVFYLVAGLVFASRAQVPKWGFNIGSTTDDFSRVVKVAPNGNVCIAGKFTGTMDLDPGPGISNITSNGADDIFLACYTSTGAFLWGFGIGGTNYDAVQAMAIDNNNNIIIGGYFQGAGIDFDPGIAIFTMPFVGGIGLPYDGDGFVAKYSSAGVFQWGYDLGGSSVYDGVSSVGTDVNGNVYVSGEFCFTMALLGGPTFNSAVDGHAFLIKYNSAGVFIWGHNFGLPGTAADDTIPYAMMISNGFVYLGGVFQATSNFDPWGAPALLTTVGYYDAFIAKYDTNGNYVFAYPISGSGYLESVYGMSLDASDNIYVTGITNSVTMTFDPTNPIPTTVAAPGGGGNYDIFIAKYNSSGKYQWGTILGNPGYDVGWSADVIGSNVYFSGQFSNTVDMDPSTAVANLTSTGGTDIYVTKYDLNGNYICGFSVGGPASDDIGYGLAHDLSGNLYSSGQFGGTAVDFDPTSRCSSINKYWRARCFPRKIRLLR